MVERTEISTEERIGVARDTFTRMITETQGRQGRIAKEILAETARPHVFANITDTNINEIGVLQRDVNTMRSMLLLLDILEGKGNMVLPLGTLDIHFGSANRDYAREKQTDKIFGDISKIREVLSDKPADVDGGHEIRP